MTLGLVYLGIVELSKKSEKAQISSDSWLESQLNCNLLSTGLRWDGGFSSTTAWQFDLLPTICPNPVIRKIMAAGLFILKKQPLMLERVGPIQKNKVFDLLVVNFQKNSENRQCLA